MNFEMLVVLVMLLVMFSLGVWFGDAFKDKRICEAWYQGLNLSTTDYHDLVLDNLTILNATRTIR